MKIQKKRIVSLDVIRIFACLCVTIVHFNASISGYNGTFVYPNSLIPNFYIEGRVYLGGMGVSLFFMLSGASLMLTYKKGNLLGFYKKRALSIYPMFWLAFALATMIDFMRLKWMAGGNPLLLLFSLAGIDGNLCALGIIPYDFYKVGEWFLGCLIAIYIIYPFLNAAVDRHPFCTLFISLMAYATYIRLAPVYGFPVTEHLFYLRIPEFILGMLFIKYDLEHRPKALIGVSGMVFLLAWIFRQHINSLTFCIAFCMVLFCAIVLLSRMIKCEEIKNCLAFGSKLTYPVFLVHHWLIDRMVQGFFLAQMPKRYICVMFVTYIIATLVLSYGLMKASNLMVSKVMNRRAHAA